MSSVWSAFARTLQKSPHQTPLRRALPPHRKPPMQPLGRAALGPKGRRPIPPKPRRPTRQLQRESRHPESHVIQRGYLLPRRQETETGPDPRPQNGPVPTKGPSSTTPRPPRLRGWLAQRRVAPRPLRCFAERVNGGPWHQVSRTEQLSVSNRIWHGLSGAAEGGQGR